jgi:hypothetical protein
MKTFSFKNLPDNILSGGANEIFLIYRRLDEGHAGMINTFNIEIPRDFDKDYFERTNEAQKINIMGDPKKPDTIDYAYIYLGNKKIYLANIGIQSRQQTRQQIEIKVVMRISLTFKIAYIFKIVGISEYDGTDPVTMDKIEGIIDVCNKERLYDEITKIPSILSFGVINELNIFFSYNKKFSRPSAIKEIRFRFDKGRIILDGT